MDFLKRIKPIKVVLLSMLMVVLPYAPAFASDDLTSIFDTKAFSGSFEVISKLNWVGWLLNGIISSFCLLGLFLIMYSRMVTLLYFSSRNLFDNIYDIKQANTGEMFGFKSLVNTTYQGGMGTGLDAFIGFFYGLLPNLKKYSDYNPEKMQYNLNENDTVISYMLKTGPVTVMLIFFFAMGFSGSLARGYGTVVKAMTTAADSAVNVNLSKYVTRIINSGNNYNFSLGADKSPDGVLKEKIAKSIYNRVVGRCEVIDTETRMTIGESIESQVNSSITPDLIKELAKLDTFTDQDWSRIKFEVIDNTNSEEGHGKAWAFSDFGISTDSSKELYIHLYLTADQPDNKINYFKKTP